MISPTCSSLWMLSATNGYPCRLLPRAWWESTFDQQGLRNQRMIPQAYLGVSQTRRTYDWGKEAWSTSRVRWLWVVVGYQLRIRVLIVNYGPTYLPGKCVNKAKTTRLGLVAGGAALLLPRVQGGGMLLSDMTLKLGVVASLPLELMLIAENWLCYWCEMKCPILAQVLLCGVDIESEHWHHSFVIPFYI